MDQVAEIAPNRSFLASIGLNSLFGDGKGDQKEDNRESEEAAHRQLIALGAVAAAKVLDHGNRQRSDDKACAVGEELTDRGDAVALVRVVGHDTGQRGVGHVVGSIDETQQ